MRTGAGVCEQEGHESAATLLPRDRAGADHRSAARRRLWTLPVRLAGQIALLGACLDFAVAAEWGCGQSRAWLVDWAGVGFPRGLREVGAPKSPRGEKGCALRWADHGHSQNPASEGPALGYPGGSGRARGARAAKRKRHQRRQAVSQERVGHRRRLPLRRKSSHAHEASLLAELVSSPAASMLLLLSLPAGRGRRRGWGSGRCVPAPPGPRAAPGSPRPARGPS